MSGELDTRLNAYRPDLADIALQGRVNAERFVAGEKRVVTDAVLDLRDHPAADSAVGTQALMGETVTVFDEADGLSWIQLDDDHYVGYVKSEGLGCPAADPTHIVTVPRTFIYQEADLRSPVRLVCSMGNRMKRIGAQTTRGTNYLTLESGGAVIADHIAPMPFAAADYVDIAALFLQTPYLWGGTSGFGLDCSGLVRLSMAMCGSIVPRDTDMQAADLGVEIDPGEGFENLQRGDLVFWKGHVAIAEDDHMAIHASGHSLQVVREPMKDAIERIARLYGSPTRVRRP
ncbi:MAG: C40 family peptidase [Hyphomicrobiales bacterium]|nr:C40 family peptidase [Hyphomicrobiales bacterium]MCP4999879.1 C40 family peptidase [Hyphomicrobiales bacterium]